MARVLVPLAPGCEELEAVTIIDLLRRGGIEVIVAGLQPGPVLASRGTKLVPDVLLDEALRSQYDMIALPGGVGANHLQNDPRIVDLVRKMADQGKFIAAICAAPKVLAKAGVLEGRRATWFPNSLSQTETRGVTRVEETVVRDGNLITSRGPGTAMDFALHLIEVLKDEATRIQVEKGLERTTGHG